MLGKEKIAGCIQSDYAEWKAAREDQFDNYDEFYRMYRCFEDSQDSERKSERSKIKIPAAREAINNFIDAMMQIIFGDDMFFDIQPVRPSPETNIRRVVMKEYIRYLFEQERFESKIEDGLKNCGIFGPIIAQIEPHIYKSCQYMTAPTDDPTHPENIIIEERETIRPRTRIISPYDFIAEPSATSIEECKGVIVRSRVKKHKIIEMAQKGILDSKKVTELLVLYGNAEEVGDSDTLDDHEREQFEQDGISQWSQTDEYELLDYWGWLSDDELEGQEGFKEEDVSRDGGAEVHAVVCNGVTLKISPNPYYDKKRPFVLFNFDSLPGHLFGPGICEASRGPSKALDATVRSRIDNKAFSINTMFGINIRKFVSGQSFKTYPGKTFLFDGPPAESLMPLIVPDVTSSTYNDAAEYERYVQSSSGISKIIGGQPSKRGEQTAHEVNILAQQASGRIRRMARRFETDFLVPLLKWYQRIIYQFLGEGEDLLVGTQTVRIQHSDASDEVNFIPMGSMRIAARNELNKRMQFLAQNANQITGPYINIPYFMKKIYEGMGFNDEDQALLINQQPNPQTMAAGNPGSAPAATPQPGSGPVMEPNNAPTGGNPLA